jgi:hypothetical protein
MHALHAPQMVFKSRSARRKLHPCVRVRPTAHVPKRSRKRVRVRTRVHVITRVRVHVHVITRVHVTGLS